MVDRPIPASRASPIGGRLQSDDVVVVLQSRAQSADLCPVPVKVGPDIRATMAAGLADKPRLKIQQAEIIRPSFGIDRDGMAAPIIRAVDEDAENALRAQLCESHFLRAIGQAMMMSRRHQADNHFARDQQPRSNKCGNGTGTSRMHEPGLRGLIRVRPLAVPFRICGTDVIQKNCQKQLILLGFFW
jgi:hypothetical protein